ncbi:MAG: VWA domain-containing protein [Rickettsiales bacterium]|nr:VWA domain-containing protein [Pseudomonadota bacterium]MDA0966403.1 VWA domain-containing protein [Pseudomonadota bacterium]MDG4543265.1 VWA domain-containing protein [Rickettsiales bacterium]MDG4545531.1 VWA domain-containing protein [Rickettsiales bacterium]MDG4547980.1 VWA domain-containing protein [Rickettsiales bacterium]
MQDNELKQLEKIRIAKASKEAKAKALSAAMDAFDEENSAIAKNNQKNSQGFSDSFRPIDNIKQNIWSTIMKKQLIVGTALAGVLAVLIAPAVLKQTKPFDTERLEENRVIQSDPVKPSEISGRNTGGVTAQGMGQVVDDIKEEAPDIDGFVDAIPENMLEAESIEDDFASIESGDMVESGIIPQQAPQAAAIAPSSNNFQKRSAYDAKVTAERAIAPYPYPMPVPHPGDAPRFVEPQNNDKFSNPDQNPVKKVSQEPVSTISVDVDTASYSYVRRTLNSGRTVHKGSVRVEELINYFDYKYPYPETSTTPFKPTMSIYPTPWNEETKLLHIGIKGYDIVSDAKPRSNLVFLIDVSGSMNSPDKLPLLKNAFRMMVNNLDDNDVVSIVTYAGYVGTALEPTPVSQKEKIFAALENLNSGGSTAGAQGIQQAYNLAERNFDKEGVNRIILATDGDFNVGMSSNEDLKRLIEDKRKSGIFLSILGFGQGNYNDALMQTLAQNGNGNAAYIDNLNEAQKVLVDEASSTLFPIAKDVKIQIEFNPNLVSEYRLIGYETRILQREDFNNDKVDAGDIGSGHTVTAIYEITPKGSKAQMIDDLRYQKPAKVEESTDSNISEDNSNEYAFLKMRYKLPNQDSSSLVQFPVTKDIEFDSVEKTSNEVRFATAVAAFGQKIRNENFIGSFTYDDIINLATGSTGEDKFGRRSEFINLVRLAKSLNN